jgi:hypothetical protein
MSLWEPWSPASLTPRQLHDLRLAAATMTGATRRAVQAEMTLQDWRGSARLADTILGWSRAAGAGGWAAQRTGLPCRGAHAACSGRQRWEEQEPEAAEALRPRAAAHAPHAPPFRTPLASPRLTATAAREALQAHGLPADPRPAPRTLAAGFNRRGSRWRPGRKAQAQQKRKATEAIVEHRKTRPPRRGRGAGQARADGVSSHRPYGPVRSRGAHPRASPSQCSCPRVQGNISPVGPGRRRPRAALWDLRPLIADERCHRRDPASRGAGVKHPSTRRAGSPPDHNG